MNDERTYIVAYDIADARRWRRVFKTMNGFGEWLQLSVFQCRLSRRRRAELETRLREIVKTGEDHVLLIDVGPADVNADTTLGLRCFHILFSINGLLEHTVSRFHGDAVLP